jgi:hypothetical protein
MRPVSFKPGQSAFGLVAAHRRLASSIRLAAGCLKRPLSWCRSSCAETDQSLLVQRILEVCLHPEAYPEFLTNQTSRQFFDFNSAKTGAMNYWRQTPGFNLVAAFEDRKIDLMENSSFC